MKNRLLALLVSGTALALSGCYPMYDTVQNTLGTALMSLQKSDPTLFQETMTPEFRAVAGNPKTFAYYQSYFNGKNVSVGQQVVLQQENHLFYDLPIHKIVDAQIIDQNNVIGNATLDCTYKYSKVSVHSEIDPADISSYRVSSTCKIDGFSTR